MASVLVSLFITFFHPAVSVELIDKADFRSKFPLGLTHTFGNDLRTRALPKICPSLHF